MLRLLILVGLPSIVACQRSMSGVGTRHVIRSGDRLRVQTRTQAHFDRAIFLKPGEIPDGGLPFDLAPLIVQEVSPSTGTKPARFGSWSTDGISETGCPRFDVDQPVVYWHESHVDLGQGRRFDQFSYLWWYPTPVLDHPPTPEGIRITIDENAYPIAWEVLTRDGWVRSVYVADSIERLAAERFGGPRPGRNHSIEPSVAEAPDVVVARVLSDGPVPMGPFVYLTASPRKIATLTCRCMPSQADEFVETGYYDLIPLDRLLDLGFEPTGRFPFVRLRCTEEPQNDDEDKESSTHAASGGSALQRLRWPG